VGVILSLNARYPTSKAALVLTDSAVNIDDPDEGGQRCIGIKRSFGNLELDGGAECIKRPFVLVAEVLINDEAASNLLNT
jgi:hypothetical protein